MKALVLSIFMLFYVTGITQTKNETAYNITDIAAEIFVELSIERDSINHAFHNNVFFDNGIYGRVISYPSNYIFNLIRFDARRLVSYFEDVNISRDWEEYIDEHGNISYIIKYDVDNTYYLVLMYIPEIKNLIISTVTIKEYHNMESDLYDGA